MTNEKIKTTAQKNKIAARNAPSSLKIVLQYEAHQKDSNNLPNILADYNIKNIYDLPDEVLEEPHAQEILNEIECMSAPIFEETAAEIANTTKDNPRLPWVIEELKFRRMLDLEYLTRSKDVLHYLLLGDGPPDPSDPRSDERKFMFRYGLSKMKYIQEARAIASGMLDDEEDFFFLKSSNFKQNGDDEETYTHFLHRTLAEAFDVIRRTQAILKDSDWDFLTQWPTFYRFSPVYTVARCDCLKLREKKDGYSITYENIGYQEKLIKNVYGAPKPIEKLLEDPFHNNNKTVAIFIAGELDMLQSYPIWTKKRIKILVDKIRKSRLQHWSETGIGPSWVKNLE